MTCAPLHIWQLPLEIGYDVVGGLQKFGIEVDAAGRPCINAAREAWAAYADKIMIGRHPQLPVPWAQLRFGWIAPEDRE